MPLCVIGAGLAGRADTAGASGMCGAPLVARLNPELDREAANDGKHKGAGALGVLLEIEFAGGKGVIALVAVVRDGAQDQAVDAVLGRDVCDGGAFHLHTVALRRSDRGRLGLGTAHEAVARGDRAAQEALRLGIGVVATEEGGVGLGPGGCCIALGERGIDKAVGAQGLLGKLVEDIAAGEFLEAGRGFGDEGGVGVEVPSESAASTKP